MLAGPDLWAANPTVAPGHEPAPPNPILFWTLSAFVPFIHRRKLKASIQHMPDWYAEFVVTEAAATPLREP